MELVYLWVEEYKNIHKQGFNFSPRFECEYDENTNKLTINKNDNYIENFFGKNINVTAIVGENGSGKSSVLEAIINNYDNNKILKIYYDSKEQKFYKHAQDFNKIKFKLNQLYIDVVEIEYKNYQKIFFSNSYQTRDMYSGYYLTIYQNKIREIKLAIHLLKNNSFKFPFITPLKLTISLNDKCDELSKLVERYIIKHDYKINFIKNNFFQLDTEIFENNLKIIHFYLLVANITLGELGLSSKFYSILFDKSPKNIDDIIIMFEQYISIDIQNKIKFILTELKDNFKSNKYGFEFSIDITKLDKNFIDEYLRITYINENIANDNNIFQFQFSPYPSEGEYQFLVFFSKIYQYFTKKNIVLLVDEGENTFHPNWQKKFINYIKVFLENNYKNINIQLIFTTHSPFLLSDLPKQNIIFLDKDEKGNCIVADGLKNKKQTFGANIHTLLSDGFFMQGGLMGEFAKGKIDEAIKLLNNSNKLSENEFKYCEEIISIIGEPIIKSQLQRMLDSKKINYIAKDVKEEIEFLKHKIDLLSKRL